MGGGGEQDKCSRIARGAAKKRTVSESDQRQQPLTKKRVVLGEITNFTGSIVGLTSKSGVKKDKLRSKKEKKVGAVKDKKLMIPKCVYEYLHSIEGISHVIQCACEQEYKVEWDLQLRRRDTMLPSLRRLLPRQRLRPPLWFLRYEF